MNRDFTARTQEQIHDKADGICHRKNNRSALEGRFGAGFGLSGICGLGMPGPCEHGGLSWRLACGYV